MKLPLVQVDAFSEGPFTGNPAAVVPHDGTLDARRMQAIAEENNLSETAFTHPLPDAAADGAPRFALRWFTPTTEVELCGHATLGAAAALRELGQTGGADRVEFETQSGALVARFRDGLVEIDLPAAVPQRDRTSELKVSVEAALGRPVESVLEHRYLLASLESEADVAAIRPDATALVDLGRPLIATARGERPDIDFVSRFFAPTLGVPEDPVTGSAHCQLVPFWADRLDRRELIARQISRRGGRLRCAVERHRGSHGNPESDPGDSWGRVRLAGGAFLYLRGEIWSG